MLHENEISAEVVQQVQVNEAEYVKFCYLIKVMDAVDRAHSVELKVAKELKSTEGLQVFMDYDWRHVVNHVHPQLQIVFLRDKFREPSHQAFMTHPFAAIVARTAVVVELDSVFQLDLEGTDVHQDVKEVTNAFRTLEATAQSLGGKRMQDGNRIIAQLRRVLKPE
jgi:hypothetical protein